MPIAAAAMTKRVGMMPAATVPPFDLCDCEFDGRFVMVELFVGVLCMEDVEVGATEESAVDEGEAIVESSISQKRPTSPPSLQLNPSGQQRVDPHCGRDTLGFSI